LQKDAWSISRSDEVSFHFALSNHGLLSLFLGLLSPENGKKIMMNRGGGIKKPDKKPVYLFAD
jgi:hypothetical protein